MRRALIENIIISIVFVFPGFLPAQSQSVRFNSISIDNGLSQNMIKCILQDNKGFMWFATWDGLNRYDGYNFKVYKNINNDSSSLRFNKVRTLFEDHKGVLWVGTFGGGLSRFNPEKENFMNLVHIQEDSNSICSDRVLKIFEDSYNRIWVGTENGLSVFDNNNLSSSAEDIKTIKFINITNNPKDSTSISSNGIQVIFEDSFGNIWFGTDDGFLNKLEAQNISLRNFNFVKFRMHWKKDQNKINLLFDDIVEDRNHPGLFWLVNYYQGISWFNSKSGDFFYQYPYHEMPSNFPISQVESCFLDSEGKFWFGTFSDGIYTFKPEKNNNSSKSFEHFILNSTENKGINVADITYFYEDKSGMIWIGTSTNGLYTYYNGVKRFTGFFNNPLSKNSLSGKDGLSVLETDNGNIWIGTESGLDNYNPVTKKFTHYKYNPYNLHSLSDNTVYSLFQDSKRILVVTRKNTFYL